MNRKQRRMAGSSRFKNKVEKLNEKQKALVGDFNQSRLELGAVILGLDQAERAVKMALNRKDEIIKKLNAIQAEYDKVSAEVAGAQASVGIDPADLKVAEPPVPEVGLTEDAKREMAEALTNPQAAPEAPEAAPEPEAATGTEG